MFELSRARLQMADGEQARKKGPKHGNATNDQVEAPRMSSRGGKRGNKAQYYKNVSLVPREEAVKS